MSNHAMPVVYLPHGGGPWPFVPGLGEPAALEKLAAYLKALRDLPPSPPRAVLVISAHWEERVATVMTSERPPLLFDYYGFPPESYQLTWPAPGDPKLAARVRELLTVANIESATNDARGFDHGAFVPLKLMYPDANVPTVQLSLRTGLDPQEHLAIGRALAPLREEGVFIVASGMSYHNMRVFQGRAEGAARDASAFDGWLRETAQADPATRDDRLAHWTTAPSARAAHPREEHLLPLMVAAGAAGNDRGRVAYQGALFGMPISGYDFGAR